MRTEILFINACVRPGSRTLRLARRLLAHLDGKVTELELQREELPPLAAAALEGREALLRRGETDAPAFRYARQFAEAEQIVLAAPYWGSELSCFREMLLRACHDQGHHVSLRS